MGNITNNMKEVRLRDKQRHFLGKIHNGKVFVYCRRCKEFHQIITKGGGATSQNPN